jgi:hypothetical protein
MEVAEAFERAVALSRHDDVVQQFDPEQLAGPVEITGDMEVGVGRLGLARGMVVHEDDSVGVGHDGGAEHFAGVGADRVQGPDGDKLVAKDAAADVENEDHETFDFGIEPGLGGNVPVPVLDGDLRRVAKERVGRHGTFTEGDDAPFLGLLVAVGDGRSVHRLRFRGAACPFTGAEGRRSAKPKPRARRGRVEQAGAGADNVTPAGWHRGLPAEAGGTVLGGREHRTDPPRQRRKWQCLPN